jgi:DNA-binding transcriptional LysR family regulator
LPLKLTYAGERFVEKARQILDLENQLMREIEDIAAFEKGHIVLGVPLFSGSFLLPVFLSPFKQKYPKIKVSITEKNSSELEQLLLKREIDFAISNIFTQCEEIIYENVLSEEIFLAIPRNQKRPASHSIHLCELQDNNFILLKQGTMLRQIANECFKEAHFKPKIFLESVSIITVVQLVKFGNGITFVPYTIARLSNLPKSFLYRIQEPVQNWDIVIAYKKGRYLSKLDQAFIAIAKETLTAQNFNL